MVQSTSRAALLLLAVTALIVPSFAQATGPDVIVGALTGPSNYTSDDGGATSAFAIGTTSCNVGTAELLWIRNTNQHPVIGQNIYRVKDGVFEMIGVSWLKHGFTALQQNLCSPCNSSGTGSRLGVGCSDPYSSGLNGSQGGLGPRYEVNAANGFFPYPYTSPSYTGNGRRLLIDSDKLNPSMNAGAAYIGEGHYVAPDDSAAGNDENNASWRLMNVSGGSATSGFSMSFTGNTMRGDPAIMAWPTINPSAQVAFQDIPGDGRIYAGLNFVPLANGNNRYIVAIHNLNSDLSVGGISVAMPNGHNSSNPEFRNVPWHSGELFKADAWNYSSTANSVRWNSPATFASDVWGSAIRWGSTFTFIFESDSAPGDITLQMFKTTGPNSITFPAFSLPTPSWETNSPDALLSIDGGTNDPFVGPIQTTAFFGTVQTVDIGGVPGSLWNIFLTGGDGVPNAFVTPNSGEIVNLDLGQPLLEVFPGFQPMPPTGGFQTPLFAPNSPTDITVQLAALTPSAPDGFYASAANEYDAVDGPVAIVTAQGSNSFNSTTSSGMWKITQTGVNASPIARVTFSHVGGRSFDLDQTNMGGTTWCGAVGGTYRLGSDALVGLVYDGQNLVGNCGNSGLIASSAFTNTVTWRFSDFDNGETFEFDIDTDGGPSSQDGASQAGMNITVELANGQIFTGTLVADANGSIAEIR